MHRTLHCKCVSKDNKPLSIIFLVQIFAFRNEIFVNKSAIPLLQLQTCNTFWLPSIHTYIYFNSLPPSLRTIHLVSFFKKSKIKRHMLVIAA